jgi:hypothetical protein
MCFAIQELGLKELSPFGKLSLLLTFALKNQICFWLVFCRKFEVYYHENYF